MGITVDLSVVDHKHTVLATISRWSAIGTSLDPILLAITTRGSISAIAVLATFRSVLLRS